MVFKDRSHFLDVDDGRALLAKAERFGIEVEYVDARGRLTLADRDSVRRIIEAMSPGEDADDLRARAVVDQKAAFAGTFDRIWGLAVQLYGVRSASNWGHGDFTDLRRLLEVASRHGASAIGLNPLHALFDDAPERASPYSPNSRLFLNPLYIDVEAAPGFPGSNATGLDQTLARLRQRELIDYAAVASAKLRGLQLAFDRFKASGTSFEAEAFEQFRQRTPELARFACFEYLRRRYRKPWWLWPISWRRPDDTALARLRSIREDAIAFFEFVQWVAERQLQACVERARQLGMPIGLYLDVAVGVDPSGFDAWNEQEAILRDFSIGAPPDGFNPGGQNWGLAGFNRVGLARRQFEPLRALLRQSMRHAGAIRLDHVLGLRRLYVIPPNASPDKGVYVRQPFEQLLEIVAEESIAHRCIVIGEDLGTVPEGLRDALAQWGIWRYHVLMFERQSDGAFVAPEHYVRNALVTNTTHDLPTFSAWCRGTDIELRRNLGLDPGETEEHRRAAHAALAGALEHDGIGTLNFLSVVQFMNAAPSRLLMISIEDVLGLVEQTNLPGTTNEHPNWRRRLPVGLERLADVASLREIALFLRSGGRAAPANPAFARPAPR
jgi:4-alpha-glucanotransferase